MGNKKKTWRLCPFKNGEVFRVTKNISAKRAKFEKDEIIIFINAEISQYTGMTAYRFKCSSGGYKIFDLADSDGFDKLLVLFQRTTKKPKQKNKFSLLTALILVALIGVLIKIIIQFAYLKESFKAAPLYAVSALIIGLLVFYMKDKLTR